MLEMIIELITNLLSSVPGAGPILALVASSSLAAFFGIKSFFDKRSMKKELAQQVQNATELAELKKQKLAQDKKKALKEASKYETNKLKNSRTSTNGPFNGVRKRHGQTKRKQ